MVDRCPFCGGPTDIPMLFPRVRQKIFCFIWENPGCTAVEIIAVIGHRSMASFSTNITCIREYLQRSTPYRLVWTRAYDRRHRYKIIHQRPQDKPTEGITNGTV